jgi:hypothetical protein
MTVKPFGSSRQISTRSKAPKSTPPIIIESSIHESESERDENLSPDEVDFNQDDVYNCDGEGEDGFDMAGFEGESNEDDDDGEYYGDLDNDIIESDDGYQTEEEEEDDPFIAELRAIAQKGAQNRGINGNTKQIEKSTKVQIHNESDNDMTDFSDNFDIGEEEEEEGEEEGEDNYTFSSFDDDDDDGAEGEYDMFNNHGEGEFDFDDAFDGEDSGDEIGHVTKQTNSGPMSITERLAAQLRLMKSNNNNNNGTHEDNDNNTQQTQNTILFGDNKPKSADPKKLQKQDKSIAIRKQLLLYQQQLKIRLFLQQPQGYLEQLPLNPQMYVKLASLDLQDNGLPNVITSTTKKTKSSSNDNRDGLELGLSTDSEVISALKQGGKIRKLDSILDNDLTQNEPFSVQKYLKSGQIPYDLTSLLSHVEGNEDDNEAQQIVENFYKQPFVKKMKLSQAITAQTLSDLIKLEHAIGIGSGAKDYDEEMNDDGNNDDNDDQAAKGKKSKKDSDKLSATFLLQDKYDDLINTNQLLHGLTAKATVGVIGESIEGNIDLYKEERGDGSGDGDDNDDNNDDNNEQSNKKQLTKLFKKLSKFEKKQNYSNILLSNYESNFDQIEDYLNTLYTTSLPRVNQIIDKWDKRTNSGLISTISSSFDLSSLSIPLSQQINTTFVTEQRRLAQRSRLRRFALHQFATDPAIQRKLEQQHYDKMIVLMDDEEDDDDGNDDDNEDDDDEDENYIDNFNDYLQFLNTLNSSSNPTLSAQERFDDYIYDDFDFTPTLIKDINTNLGDGLNNIIGRGAGSAGHQSTALNLSLQQLHDQQSTIKKQLKQTTYQAQHGTTRHGEKKRVKIGQINQKAVNFVVPRVSLTWARANGLEFTTGHSTNRDTDELLGLIAARQNIDQVLGSTSNDAVFVDNLFLHLFGQKQQRSSRHADAQKRLIDDEEEKKNNNEDEDEDDGYNRDDDNVDDGGFDEDDEIDINAVDDYETEFGGDGVGSWFGGK